jgi:hypothetical protein
MISFDNEEANLVREDCYLQRNTEGSHSKHVMMKEWRPSDRLMTLILNQVATSTERSYELVMYNRLC